MTLILFVISCIYIAVGLPSIPAEEDAARNKPVGLARFIGPLRIFAPQRWTLPNGRTTVQFGALNLGIGVFMAILATGYIATLFQMYSTNEFGFGTRENGWLIFMYSLLRGLYLSLVFPRIIAIGRKWLKGSSKEPSKPDNEPEPESAIQDRPPSPNQVDVPDSMDNETEPLNPPERKDERETFKFDLFYARFSLLADGIMTGLAVFISDGWQLYIFAFILPLAAGTGAASKGTILQMIPSKDRVDALSGITLVENIARLSTSEFCRPLKLERPESIDRMRRRGTRDWPNVIYMNPTNFLQLLSSGLFSQH